MTSRDLRQPLRRRAFTLVEVLVVIAIIAVLIGILIPAVMKGGAAAEVAASTQFMNSIRTGLISYQRDHNALPPSHIDNSNLVMDGWKGGEIVCQLMIGYLPEGASPADGDGQDNVGFRRSRGSNFYGEVFGPYVEQTSSEDLADGDSTYGPGSEAAKVFVDRWDNPIAYYNALAGQSNLWSSATNPATRNARFLRADNDGIDGAGDPSIDDHPDIDASALRSAEFVLYTVGPDGKNDDGDDRADDLIVTGP